MKKVLLVIMLALSTGLTTSSCSKDNEVEECYERILAEKIQMLNDFLEEYKEYEFYSFGVYVGDICLGEAGLEGIEIINERYVKIGNTKFDLLHFVGYAIGGKKRGLYFSN